ncbi:glycosyltransferase family 4 protein, partial [Noviherbaspirillum sp.]|uniref:glycosyltransferase family 4 protein n=1 Tax=Noviherbaspirillum sp. TaxID=1926288 RepID=UPI002FE37E56
MRVLIVNHYSGSAELGMGYRHFYLAKEMQAAGHAVAIVASRFSHLRIRQPETRLADPHAGWNDHCGIPHLWLGGRPYHGNGLPRLLNMIEFAGDLWRRAPGIAGWRPDVVLASSPHPFAVYGAVRLARRAGARLLFEIRDLWPLSLMELGAIPARHPLMRAIDHAEAFGCRHADKVISLLPCVDEYLALRGVGRDRWINIPNGVWLREWREPWPALDAGTRDALAALRAQGRFIVGYAGSHGLANALDTLVDTAAAMRDEQVAFVLVGDGPEKTLLRQRVAAKGLRDVHFLDPVGKDQIPALLQWFDAAYIGWHRQPLYRFGIAPNKLMDYMMAARPVVHAVEAGNDAVGESGCGVTVRPEDPRAVADAVRGLMRLDAGARAS